MRAGRRCKSGDFMHPYPAANLRKFNDDLERGEPVLIAQLQQHFDRIAAEFGPVITAAGVACFIAPSLGRNVSPTADGVLLTLAAAAFPTSCWLVLNPVGRGGPLKYAARLPTAADNSTLKRTVFLERHDTPTALAAPCTWTNDGERLSVDDYFVRRRRNN